MMFTPPLHTRLDELAVIEFAGPDAVSFLHGQITQDVSGLPQGQARPAGYCTAKGRLLATMVFWRSGAENVRALVRADLADVLAKRLGMFVLRAKVSVRRLDSAVWGVGLPAGEAHEAGDWAVRQAEDGDWVHAPSAPGAEIRRCWYVAQAGSTPPGMQTSGWAQAWRAQDIQAGLPWVQAATQELFIPQTLNLDLIDGVSFTKGCYPRQEVVARSHYRGTIKRRMSAGSCPAALGPGADAAFAPGTDIYDAAKPDAPWGRVVNSQIFDGRAWLLFEAQLADLNQAELRLGSPQGPVIELAQLPYFIMGD